MKPFILVNFKTYTEGTGKKAVALAKKCQKASGTKIAVAVQHADIREVSSKVKIPVWAQHTDNIKPERSTGFITPESIKQAGAKGTLINHAEHKIKHKDIEGIIKKCRKLKLLTMVCASNKKKACEIAKLKPDFIAVEPPALIGTGISVSEASPGIIKDSVKEIRKTSRKTQVFCGAGITKGTDVKKALELGSSGVLVASGIVKSKNQTAEIRELVKNL